MIVNFGFVIDNELAGLAHPDTFGDTKGALEELCTHGIGAVVSLDEYGIPPEAAEECGLVYKHIPIPDFHAPDLKQADEFVDFVTLQRSENRTVGVHCRGGYGRTGTLIACYLISQGKPADEAINLVRRRRPGSIETAGQEHFLHQYEKHLRRR